MAYTAPWDETAPLGDATQASDIDLLFRQLKRDFRERLNTGFVDFTTDPVRPKSLLLGSFATSIGTGAVTTEVTLRTFTILANSLGINGIIRLTFGFSIQGANNTKDLRVKFGGSSVFGFQWAAGSTINGFCTVIIANRAVANAQVNVGHCTTINSTGEQHTTGLGTTAIDTTIDKDLIITGQTANAADEVTVEVALVEILRAA